MINNNFIELYQKRCEKLLRKHLTSNSKLKEVMSYSVLGGGKRFRPILVYATAKAFSSDINIADNVAVAVELIHAYSLIHDDLPCMDDDDIRHNKPSCHKKFNEALAVLAGDGLHSMAFELLANDKNLSEKQKVKMFQSLAKFSFMMVEGQMIDIELTGRKVNDISELNKMYYHKTAALLRLAVRLGALTNKNIGNSELKYLDKFAKNIGLAYQIQDDILDIIQDEKTLGKTKDSDFYNNKTTYPSIIGIVAAKKKYQLLYTKALSFLDKINADTIELKKLIILLRERAY